MRALRLAGLVVVATSPWIVAGCSATGAPAPVVQGKIQGDWQRNANAVGSSTARPMVTVAAQPVVVAQPAAPTVPLAGLQEEDLDQVAHSAPSVAALANLKPAAGPATVVATEDVASDDTYTVKETDTLFKIARMRQTSPETLVRLNGLSGVADITPGQSLRLPPMGSRVAATPGSLTAAIGRYLQPPSSAAAPEAASPELLVVPRAEPLPTPRIAQPISRSFEIARLEPAAGPSLATAPADRPAQGPSHVVTTGETIFRISRQYGVSVLDVMAANDLERPEALQAGMRLAIPVSQTEPELGVTEAKPTLRPAADLGVVEATRATIAAARAALDAPNNGSAGPERPLLDTDKGTDNADTVQPLRAAQPITENDKLRAELRRGQVDRDAARQRGLVWPLRGKILKPFGEKGNGVAHTGINIETALNTPVLAADSGQVLYASNGLRGYGNMVLIRHDHGGMVSAYAHANHLLVRKGERVKKAQIIAVSGQSGNVDSPQLHFELRRNARAVDPLKVLPK